MNREDLRMQCEQFSNQTLYEIVHQNTRFSYSDLRYHHDLAIAAKIELTRRALSKAEINSVKMEHRRLSRIVYGNINDDIYFMEKLLFYFICIPTLNYIVRRRYRKGNCVLKWKQAWYYTFLGAFFIFMIIFLGWQRISMVTGIILWLSGFLVAFAFDTLYYKDRTKKTLRKFAGKTGAEDNVGLSS